MPAGSASMLIAKDDRLSASGLDGISPQWSSTPAKGPCSARRGSGSACAKLCSGGWHVWTPEQLHALSDTDWRTQAPAALQQWSTGQVAKPQSQLALN